MRADHGQREHVDMNAVHEQTAASPALSPWNSSSRGSSAGHTSSGIVDELGSTAHGRSMSNDSGEHCRARGSLQARSVRTATAPVELHDHNADTRRASVRRADVTGRDGFSWKARGVSQAALGWGEKLPRLMLLLQQAAAPSCVQR
jgi:hypothetical protein